MAGVVKVCSFLGLSSEVSGDEEKGVGMRVFTMGFTKKSAEQFFGRLQGAGVKRVVDVRLNNRSQLSGFAKRDDLGYFLNRMCGMEYVHALELAPTKEIFDGYKKEGWSWGDYERAFFKLLEVRKVETKLGREFFEDACLLCSEDTAERCHRRLVAEYFQECWGGVEVVHL